MNRPAPDPQALAKAAQTNQSANRYGQTRREKLAKLIAEAKAKATR